MSFLKRWWPAPASTAIAVTVQQVALTSRYDVGGHASEHLGSASAVFVGTAVAFVLLWTTPVARRSPVVLGGLAAWLLVGVLVLVGNVRVVDSLIDSGQATAPTDALVERASVSDAHELADSAMWFGSAAGVVIVVGLRRLRALSSTVAIVAGVVCVLFPPWIVPGFGVAVAAVARCIARERDTRLPPPAIVVA